jgi:pimeloyl-ACP methyl ester carboxylesterase
MPINLDTHILDVQNVILWEDLSDVVLCGHSYGGLVISGVADRIAERIASLVFIEAVLPEDGDSLLTLRSPLQELFLKQAGEAGGMFVPARSAAGSGVNKADRAWVDAKCVQQPLASFCQAIRLTGRDKQVKSRILNYPYSDERGSPAGEQYESHRGDPRTQVFRIERSGHDVMVDQPEELGRVLLMATAAVTESK